MIELKELDYASRASNKLILKLAIPSLFALIAEPVLGLVDTAFVGHLGVNELGALALITSFLSSVIWVFNFFVSGTTANIAVLAGKKEFKTMTDFYYQSQILAIVIGSFMAIMGIIFEPMVFRIMGDSNGTLRTTGHLYYFIRLAGFPFILSYFVSMGFLRGIQNMKTPMIITVTINLINIGLDYLFIYGIPNVINGFGLTGAAIATVTAQIVSFIWFSMVIYQNKLVGKFSLDLFISPNLEILGQIFRVNRNLFFRTLFLLGSFTFATAMAARMDKIILGAHQVGIQLWLFCSFAIDSFAIAGQSISGYLKGKGNDALLKSYGKFLQMWGISLGICFSLAFFAFKPYIVPLFTNDPSLKFLVHDLFIFIIIFQPFNGITFILDGVLIGILDTRFLMIQLFIASILVYIPISYLSLKLDWGIKGIWSGLAIFLVIRMLMNEWRFIKMTLK